MVGWQKWWEACACVCMLICMCHGSVKKRTRSACRHIQRAGRGTLSSDESQVGVGEHTKVSELCISLLLATVTIS